jgi:hypothetical protein
MRMMRRASILIAAAVVLALPGQAFGLTLTPPGKSGADQYFETVPASGGNAAPPQGTSPGSGAFRHLGQGRAGDTQLSHMGADGAAAAALAAATAPTPAGGSGTGTSGGQNGIPSSASQNGSGQIALSQPKGQSASTALANALTGSGNSGLGVLLPVLLIGALLMAIVYAVFRLRHRPQPPDITA